MFRTPGRGRVRAFPTVALLTATLLAASCSSDDDTADSGDTTSPAAATTDAPEPTDAPTTTDQADTTDAPATTESTDTTEPSGDFDPYAQTLEWSECEWGECAEIEVPIDYDDPSAGTATIAMSRLAATSGDPIGTLFINPGGPGETGVDRIEDFEFLGAPELLEAYDIVGFDPRGVGQSDPVMCLDDAGLDELRAFDFDADDPASVDAYAELLQGQADACLANSPELAQHVTTVETAKDMDIMRELVGDDQMHYIGFSYGTFLGATYAALFPDKVGRMVLDGPEDPALSEAEKSLRVLGGLQTALDDYAADCVANECPLGASVEEIDEKLAALFETAKDEPLPTGEPDRPLTRPLAFLGVIRPLYSQDLWPALTESLAAGFEGDGSALLASSDEYANRVDGVYTTNGQVITAINCLDAQLAPPSDAQPTKDEFVAASSVFGEIAYDSSAVGCAEWPIAPTVTAPDYTAPGAAAIIVIGTTGDPVTPYENAVQLADELESGVLLARDGEGHTAYFSNKCIADTVNAYLIDGTVPEDGTECADADEAGDASGEDGGQDVALIAGDEIVIVQWTECSWDGSTLELSATGDGLEVDATTADDGTVEVVVSGSSEASFSGTAEDVDGTLIVQGTLTADDGTTADATFSLDATTCT